jgi:hypothetical protein
MKRCKNQTRKTANKWSDTQNQIYWVDPLEFDDGQDIVRQ